jgi:hypothetical protein
MVWKHESKNEINDELSCMKTPPITNEVIGGATNYGTSTGIK